MKRILLFVATNVAILLVLSITLRLLGVDRILDMTRTMVNVGSDVVTTIVVDAQEDRAEQREAARKA